MLNTENVQLLKTTIKKVIDKADPMRLLLIGAPSDEYDLEVDLIFAEVTLQDSFDNLDKVIYNTFKETFDEVVAHAVCVKIANEIKAKVIL